MRDNFCHVSPIKGLPEDGWQTYDNGHQQWDYIEFGYRYDSWKKFYRALYTKPEYEDRQRLLEFARPDNIILTNTGMNPKVIENLSPEKQEEITKAEAIINSHHQRGADELPHRGLKDFGFEELPFKRFAANSAFYYCMVISFFLFETFKEDVLEEVIPIASYATTVRRKALDFAAKIVKTGRGIILRVTQTVMDRLRFKDIWERCQTSANSSLTAKELKDAGTSNRTGASGTGNFCHKVIPYGSNCL